MISLNFLKNKRIGVLGFGKTGRAIVDSLAKSGAEIFLYDDIGVQDKKYQKYSADLTDETLIKALDAIVVSPGIHFFWPIPHKTVAIARKYGIEVTNDIDLFQKHKQTDQKVVAITGTNGKSTTTALIQHLFEKSGRCSDIGGNFGPPVLSLNDDRKCFVLELSSYQLEQSKIFGFETAILLNITPDHITRHGGMEGYIAAKQRVFINCKNAIVGIDDNHCEKIFSFLRENQKETNCKNLIPISGKIVPKYGIGWQNDQLIDDRFGKSEIICKKHSQLDGAHNRQNIAAAYAACALEGISKDEFNSAMFSFSGLEHRQEFVANINGIPYINDSKATNADSVEQALLRFDNIFWILGGRPKEDGIDSLKKYFPKIKKAFLIGEAAEKWFVLLNENGVTAEIVGTLQNAVEAAHREAKKAKPDVILLSPACASFDQFKSFEERGEKFKDFVKKLESQKID